MEIALLVTIAIEDSQRNDFPNYNLKVGGALHSGG